MYEVGQLLATASNCEAEMSTKRGIYFVSNAASRSLIFGG